MQDQSSREHFGLLAFAGLVAVAIAFGMPSEQLTQNAFKSAVIALGLVVAYAMQATGSSFDWKKAAMPAVAGTGCLAIYSLISVLWSGSWMGLEAAGRWSMIAFVTLYIAANKEERTTEVMLAALWAGAVAASATGVFQFLTGWSWIDQAVAPSSTFANRNIAGEYMVAALPVGVHFATRAGDITRRRMLAAAVGVVLAFTIMVGSRAVDLAIVAMMGMAVLVSRARTSTGSQDIAPTILVASAVCGALLVIPSFAGGTDFAGMTAIEWAWRRVTQTGADWAVPTSSLGLRAQMWKATVAMIIDAPILGIGAGAWEVEVPKYLVMPTLLEADYFAHCEPLQLVAEFGVVGWVALLAFAWWFAVKCLATMSANGPRAKGEEVASLVGLVGLAIVALAGFPLHQAGTIAAFGVLLGVLNRKAVLWLPVPRMTLTIQRGVKIVLILWVAALAVMQTAAAAGEAALIALRRADPVVALQSKVASAEWAREATEAALFQLNSRPWFEHVNRVQIPPIANSLAKAGDYQHAVQLWEGVAKTRPHLVALKCILMKASAAAGDVGRALQIYTDPSARPCQLDFDAQGEQELLTKQEEAS